MSIYGVKAAVHLAGFPDAEIWRMGGRMEAIGIRLGETHHILICTYATESGEWAALLMDDKEEHPLRIDEEAPLDSLTRWQLLSESFGYARRVLAATEPGAKASENATMAAFSLAAEFGWDIDADVVIDEWMEWCNKATEQEILGEGLRRALAHCHIGQKE